MPAPEVANERQRAVLWPFTRYDSYGRPLQGAPEEIAVRWVDGQSEALDPQGNTVAIDATVTTHKKITIGSALWKGKLADWYATGSAGDSVNVMEVKTSNGTPDLKNRFTAYSAGLVRRNNVSPDR